MSRRSPRTRGVIVAPFVAAGVLAGVLSCDGDRITAPRNTPGSPAPVLPVAVVTSTNTAPVPNTGSNAALGPTLTPITVKAFSTFVVTVRGHRDLSGRRTWYGAVAHWTVPAGG